MKLGFFHFQLLYGILENVHFIHDEYLLAGAVLSTMSEALNAEGGSIFKVLPNGSIVPLAAYGAPIEALKKTKFVSGQGVVGWVAHHGQAVKVDDSRKDPRFMSDVDVSTGFKTKSIIAAPILSRGNPIGIIEFLNRRDGPFANADLELIKMAGREIGIAFENAMLRQRIEHNTVFQEAVFNSISAGVLIVDPANKVLKMNPKAQEVLGVTFEESASGDHPPVSIVLAKLPELAQAIEAPDSLEAMSRQLSIRVDGRDVMVSYTKVPVIGNDSACLGAALIFHTAATPHVATAAERVQG